MKINQSMLRQLTLLYFLVLWFSCGEATPETAEAVAAETSQPTEETSASLDVKVATAPEAPTMPKDQVEQTAKAAPELIDASKILEASPKPRVTAAKAVAAPKPVPKPKTTIVSATAPSAPSPAPAPAPAKETAPAAPAAPAATPAPAVETKPATPDHATFNSLLGQHVNSKGNVNYAALKKDEAKLDIYLAELSENSPQSGWSRNESMAFWINAYNANTLKLILKNYPLKSIIDLNGGKPWDVKWINIGGKTYSLNNIEHDIIRPRYKDARIHFAVNCAAASCPPLPNKAFTSANLNSLLESRTKSFVRNSDYNTISGESVKVSKIFDWYGEDFGDLRKYLNKYATTEIPESTEIGFKEYDWALNGQ